MPQQEHRTHAVSIVRAGPSETDRIPGVRRAAQKVVEDCRARSGDRSVQQQIVTGRTTRQHRGPAERSELDTATSQEERQPGRRQPHAGAGAAELHPSTPAVEHDPMVAGVPRTHLILDADLERTRNGDRPPPLLDRTDQIDDPQQVLAGIGGGRAGAGNQPVDGIGARRPQPDRRGTAPNEAAIASREATA